MILTAVVEIGGGKDTAALVATVVEPKQRISEVIGYPYVVPYGSSVIASLFVRVPHHLNGKTVHQSKHRPVDTQRHSFQRIDPASVLKVWLTRGFLDCRFRLRPPITDEGCLQASRIFLA